MRTILTEQEIQVIVQRLAREMQLDQGDKPIVLLPILCGASVFSADLIRNLAPSTELLPIVANRRQGIDYVPDLPDSLENFRLWLVDTTIQTGNTLRSVQQVLDIAAMKS